MNFLYKFRNIEMHGEAIRVHADSIDNLQNKAATIVKFHVVTKEEKCAHLI